jgi:hypothetical protein
MNSTKIVWRVTDPRHGLRNLFILLSELHAVIRDLAELCKADGFSQKCVHLLLEFGNLGTVNRGRCGRCCWRLHYGRRDGFWLGRWFGRFCTCLWSCRNWLAASDDESGKNKIAAHDMPPLAYS